MTGPDAAAPPDEWAELAEALTRGLVHAFNNRLASMGAYVQLLAMGDDEVSPQEVLPGELAQVEQAIGHLRVLCAERRPAEAIELAPAVQEVVSLHAHHPRLRDVRCDVAPPPPNLMPARVPRWALTRLLLLLIADTKQALLRDGRDSFELRMQGDEHSLVVRLPTGDAAGPYTESLAALCGATIERGGDATLLRLPSLLAVRLRERAERDAARGP